MFLSGPTKEIKADRKGKDLRQSCVINFVFVSSFLFGQGEENFITVNLKKKGTASSINLLKG
jgi:hypothetical protein